LDTFLQQVINGLSLGAIYALIGLLAFRIAEGVGSARRPFSFP